MFSGSSIFVGGLSVGIFTDRCKVSASFNNTFLVSSPTSRLMVVLDCVDVKSRTISLAGWRRRFSNVTLGNGIS